MTEADVAVVTAFLIVGVLELPVLMAEWRGDVYERFSLLSVRPPASNLMVPLARSPAVCSTSTLSILAGLEGGAQSDSRLIPREWMFGWRPVSEPVSTVL